MKPRRIRVPNLTVQQAAAKFGKHVKKFGKHVNTIRRALRTGALAGRKVSGRSGGEWRVSGKAELKRPEPPKRGAAAMSVRELREAYAFSRFLTVGVSRDMIREMIRHDFF